ncbi:type II toxin-antitoxin system RelE/ParE family toxin [Patescibacteria group bacterium]|nr:type II toxin-antitoxin system RelE/ParE family toxin [Patescibacteria group bacterium]MBU4023297.1 type II toxin-antitoxin system RelE/ParE family toxin [Patescibacteria group bacterium]MBU4078137.1 type II toxin-antitoxin system RelE/ParE family toxin [Patescibacteria group bacterium]
MEIEYSRRFFKSLEKLPEFIQEKAEEKDDIFRQNAFHPLLQTHKLKGKLKNYCSYSVDNKYRVLFRFKNKNKVIYFDIGTHDIYN